MKTNIDHKTLVTNAAAKLSRSERGQMACKLIRDLLTTGTVNGLDSSNMEAMSILLVAFATGDASDANLVIEVLDRVVQKNQWVLTAGGAK